jgi:long-chain acyl-CoA synthetase
MSMSYDEAVATLTAAGGPFELVEADVFGVRTKVFKRAPETLRDFVGTARTRGDADFLVYEDERWSFARVMEHVDALGATLVNRYGVTKGDRVAIGMRNYPEWVISWAAIVSIGAISVSLNAWWTDDELDFALEDSGATVLIADPERARTAHASTQRLGCRVIVVRGEADDADRYDDVVELGTTPPPIDIAADDDATIPTRRARPVDPRVPCRRIAPSATRSPASARARPSSGCATPTRPAPPRNRAATR